jgi:hypothetical protein
VFSEEERRERSTGTFGTAVATGTGTFRESASQPPRPRRALRDPSTSGAVPLHELSALRAELPFEPEISDDPGALHLPGARVAPDPQPIVLTRPKR